MTQFYIITLFPESIRAYLGESILARAIEAGLISVELVNPRDFTEDKHQKADDRTYGGGPGMVLKAEPILRAVESIQKRVGPHSMSVFMMSPGGPLFDNIQAQKLSKKEQYIVLIAGRYEGIDDRARKILKAKELSIGNYVLSGGELPALVVLEAIARQIPGVLGKEDSIEENRHGAGVPVYTRPDILEWKGKQHPVPKVLTSGDHKKIDEWREENKRG